MGKQSKIQQCLLMATLVGSFSYALDIPQQITLEYSGPYGIPATMVFNHDNNTYSIETSIAIPFKPMRFSTKGIIQNNQLIPAEYTVYRSKKLYSSAIFDYLNQKITYGKKDQTHTDALKKNSQDLFSVAWQMTINQGLPLHNTNTTNGKKIYPLPSLTQAANKSMRINNQKQESQYYKGGQNDHRLEIGLAQNLHFVPSVIVYYDKGTRYELELRKANFK